MFGKNRIVPDDGFGCLRALLQEVFKHKGHKGVFTRFTNVSSYQLSVISVDNQAFAGKTTSNN